jgi:Fe-S-cluster containining protein
MSETTSSEDAPSADCEGCGRCCQTHGPHLDLHASDIARWEREGRTDILAEVDYDPARAGAGGRVGGWRGEPLACPFLTAEQRCAIHETKPLVCAMFALGGPECLSLRSTLIQIIPLNVSSVD